VRYWAGATGLTLVSIGFSDADRFLLSRMVALELLPLFHVGSRVMRLANRFLAVFVLSFRPEVTRLDAEGRPDQVSSSTRVFEKFNIAVSVLSATLIMLYAREIILVIVNAEYLDAVPLMVVMAFSLPLTAATAPLTSVMKGRDQIGGALACNVAWVTSYLVLLVSLTWAFGLMGAGAALTCACAVQLGFALWLSDLGMGGLISAALVRAVVSAVPAAAVVLAATAFDGWALKLAAGVPAIVVYRLVAYRLGFFEPEERERLAALLGRGPARFVRHVL
jgi:O-antigen/teichoic acid export membrane protein